MRSYSCTVFLALLAASTTTGHPLVSSPANISCPIIFDGRVPSSLSLTDFDASGAGSPFGPDYVKGAGLEWSDILLFPSVPSSRFDNAAADGSAGGFKPVEVTLSDKSIFQSQRGFRRAGLQFNGDPNTGSPGYVGVKTLHWSVRQDAARPMNLSHEYLVRTFVSFPLAFFALHQQWETNEKTGEKKAQWRLTPSGYEQQNVWHEASDYSADQIMFEAGTILGQTGLPRSNFKIFDRGMKQLWSTPIDATEWQNFAATLDLDKNTVRIYYSKGDAPLAAVTGALSADLSGGGQFQIGMLKKPTGTSDVVNSGYQESGIKEGQIYGGLFVEDSTNGCISL
ncbi:hypothetical protein NKR23_g440 [Pleurostoma richardsiae]|uniref:Glycoside hydrolase 131 catalytic N-terminal domain-containing protein n=1 Tax=Pleurostoma richardsiae TaxID=41990 RepID=A0AA38VL12_9PEZI|nr:hypothetical protein NKR23_g440 [Pleurostoma richardsiae]